MGLDGVDGFISVPCVISVKGYVCFWLVFDIFRKLKYRLLEC